jgi:hypothetical protein
VSVPLCLNECGKPGVRSRRGLCYSCYAIPGVKDRYKLKNRGQVSLQFGPICRHCKERPVNRPRGLCWKCFYEPGVKEHYPSTSKYAARGTGAGFKCRAPLPATPTTALPGSAEKVRVLRERAKRGEQLFHPRDARPPAADKPEQWQALPVVVDRNNHKGDRFMVRAG